MKQSSSNMLVWFFLITSGVFLFILGVIGFSNYAVIHHTSTNIWDHIYLSMQLIPMNSGGLEPPVPLELNIARFLIPILTFATAIKAFLDLFSEQLSMVKLAFMRRHIIICGLSRKGFLLASKFHQQDKNVVIIEKNEENPWIESCRDQGMSILIGDATDDFLLKRAGVERAQGVFVVCENDGVNAEIAVQIQMLCQQSDNPLTCLVHIGDPQLCALLRQQEQLQSKSSFNLELFNVYERSARLLLDHYPAWKTPLDAASPPHILLIGLGKMGENLILHAAQDWQIQSSQSKYKIHITIIDRNAHEKYQSLIIRYPHLSRFCELIPLQMDIRSSEFEKADYIKDQAGNICVDQVFICVDDDSLALHIGLTLQRQMKDTSIPIVMRMTEESGLTQMIENHKSLEGAYKNIYAFGLLDRSCTPDLLNSTPKEILARAAYEDYIYHCRQNNPEADTVKYLPWDKLGIEERAKNYHWVDHISTVLDSIGYELVFNWNFGSDINYLNEEQIETVAAKEHDLWRRDKEADGWRFGKAPKNSQLKTHPDLVDWDRLAETEKEKNRQFLHRLPIHLARAGYYAQPQSGPTANTRSQS